MPVKKSMEVAVKKPKKETDICVSEQPITPANFSAENLIAQAITQSVPVETMEKLLAMRRELKAEFAKEQFDQAMANFQGECPVIEKKKGVDFTSKRTGSRTKYNYAPLDEIVRQVKDIISRNGLSYTIETENTITSIASIVKVRHIAGHSEITRFEVPIDKESFMSAQQQYGSASTFGKRYAFCNAFGILTGDEDNDGQTDTPVAPVRQYSAPISNVVAKVVNYPTNVQNNAIEPDLEVRDEDIPQGDAEFVDFVENQAEAVGTQEKMTARPWEKLGKFNPTGNAPIKTCPFCGKQHQGTYDKCRECWSAERGGKVLTKVKTLKVPNSELGF